MTKLFQQAVAEITSLPEPEQDRIGRALQAYLEKRRLLQSDIDRGIRSLDAGEGRELDIQDVIARARARHGKR